MQRGMRLLGKERKPSVLRGHDVTEAVLIPQGQWHDDPLFLSFPGNSKGSSIINPQLMQRGQMHNKAL